MQKTFISVSLLAGLCFAACATRAQVLDSLLGSGADTTLITNKDAIYNRPFVLSANYGMSTTAIGGYIEGNTNYFSTDGISDGFSMELRRFNIFIYSTIANRIKFLSEVEFEHGTEEINLETALIDFELHPAFNFRAGIILPPIGYFNQNHDSPKWEFIDRPLVSTTLIPATLSEVGFGFHGKIPVTVNDVFTYEIYAVNGLRDGIIANSNNRADLQEGKSSEMFAEDNNGKPMYTGRMAWRNRGWGELGLSYYGGVYNTFQLDGLQIDDKRHLRLYAFDYSLKLWKVQLNGEIAKAVIRVPLTYIQQFGNEQVGMHADIIFPLRKGRLLGWEQTTLNLNFRYEYIDYNRGVFNEGGEIGDEIKAIVPGVSLRLQSNTVLKANYRYYWQQDILNNPYIRTAGFQFGFASYF